MLEALGCVPFMQTLCLSDHYKHASLLFYDVRSTAANTRSSAWCYKCHDSKFRQNSCFILLTLYLKFAFFINRLNNIRYTISKCQIVISLIAILHYFEKQSISSHEQLKTNSLDAQILFLEIFLPVEVISNPTLIGLFERTNSS